jgi:D-tyrosyl-tRNA(Tyr) deacylase
MRAIVQRVSWAEVEIDGHLASRIGTGLMVLLGVAGGDTGEDADFVARKLSGLRLFPDDDGKMNLSLEDLDPKGEALVIPNFTVYGDTRKGRRPSYVAAAAPEAGEPLYESVCSRMEELGVRVGRGVFGAHMHCRLENDGPVTVIVDSARGKRDE